jgi:hypothetical protein
MSSPALAAIIAFAAGVIVTALGGWFSRQLEQRKHVAQLASAALVDAIKAIAEYQQCEDALTALGDHMPDDEKAYWRRRIFETRSNYFSAKARIGAFGNSEVNGYLASIERRGGVTGNDAISRQLAAKAMLSFRRELGFRKNDIPEQDIAAVLFGPTPAERESQPTEGLRGWRPFP